MDAIEALLTRRAVREYTSEPVSEEDLQTVLKAAMYAPSACNQQPWHFIVLSSREMLNAVADVHPYAQMLRQAPAAVLVCADVSLETCPNNWGVDCSAAMQNLLLAAHAVGLSSVWVGIFPHEERMQDIARALALPGHIRPVSLAPLGHPKNPLPAADRFLPERIHRNGW